MSNKSVFFGILAVSALQASTAFQATSRPDRNAATKLSMVAVDPTTVTKKEYEDICGVSFDDEALSKRLQATNYLYPKHVEVIEDIAPIAGEMVDSVVSNARENFFPNHSPFPSTSLELWRGKMQGERVEIC